MALNQTTVPAICYVNCNNALIEAQSTEKSQLCRPDSTFQDYVSACRECLKAHSRSTTDVDRSLQPYLDYCSETTAAPTAITTTERAAPSVGSASSQLITTNVVYSTELGGHSTMFTQQHIYTSYAPVPATAVFTAAATLADGRLTTYSDTITYSLFGGSTTTSSGTSVGNTPCEQVLLLEILSSSLGCLANPLHASEFARPSPNLSLRGDDNTEHGMGGRSSRRT
ncbi:hypothetical protein PG994_008401 [Apiospora phragmitis]|uniref:Uncharacterized protein n=1 Tax=Apiospora phragmitis TaxID=2905665 RepID=A0ABR1USY1_9PEZI